MNARFSFFSLIAAFAVVSNDASAGSGGGSGDPETPYRGHAPTLAEIEGVRRDANTGFPDVRGPGRDEPFENLCFARKGKCLGDEFKSFSGQSKVGLVKVSLADVSKLKLVHVTGRGSRSATAVMEVSIFPDITPAELLRTNPTYSNLPKRTLTLSVALVREDGAELSFGNRVYADGTRAPRFEDLAEGRSIKAYSEGFGFWWAIPSVISDPNFPYRDVAKN